MDDLGVTVAYYHPLSVQRLGLFVLESQHKKRRSKAKAHKSKDKKRGVG